MIRIGKALSWDELANIYDKEFGGRRARTLPMDTIFYRVAALDNMYIDKKEGTLHEIIRENDQDI